MRLNLFVKTILTIVLLLIFITVSGQDKAVIKSHQNLVIGFDGYYGYDKIGDVFTFKSNENLLIRNAYTPFIGLMHVFNSKVYVTAKLGYSFMKSSDYETTINSYTTIYKRKLRDVKIDIDFNYFLIDKKKFALLISGEIGINNITEKIEGYKNNKYTKFGYGIGIGFRFRDRSMAGLLLKIDYYRIGESKLIGTGFELPIYSIYKK